MLPEAARTRIWNFRIINSRCRSSIVTVVCSRSDHCCWGLFRKSAARLSAVAPPAQIQQIWHNYLQELTATSLLPSWGCNCIIFWRFPPMPSLHWGQSEALPQLKFAWAWDMVSTDCSHAARSNTTGRRQWRNAVRRPPVAAWAQLNVSDDMTPVRKNAHCSSAALSDTRSWSLEALWLCNSCAMRQLLIMHIPMLE